MYMCVKLPLGNLNPGSCPSHPTNTYTCEVIIAPRVRDSTYIVFKIKIYHCTIYCH